MACRDSFRAEYVVGSQIQGYINPEAPLNVVRSVSIATGPLAAFLVFASLSVVFLVLTCRLFIQDRCSGRNAPDDALPCHLQQRFEDCPPPPPPRNSDFFPMPPPSAFEELTERVNHENLFSPAANGTRGNDMVQWMSQEDTR